jgi:NitT/TauT family transport system substrate-binding protein
VKKHLSVLIGLFILGGALLAGCAGGSLSPSPAIQEAVVQSYTVYAPESTSSIPVILAANSLPEVELVLFSDHSQANAMLLRGDTQMLVTGLSVGVDMFRNGAPVQLVNNYVTGLSYLVTSGEPVSDFNGLRGKEVIVPFEGSPIEEISVYLANQKGLNWGSDITPRYSPFDASVALLKGGQAQAVILPEPLVSSLEGQSNIFVNFGLAEEWNRSNPGSQGYPQVGVLVNSQWAAEHPDEIERFNQALVAAIARVQQDPSAAVAEVASSFKQPPAILEKALGRTTYQLSAGSELQQLVLSYYTTIGKPLDESFANFTYLPAQ